MNEKYSDQVLDLKFNEQESFKNETKERLDKHDDDISELKEFKGGVNSSIQSLSKSIENINATAKWGIGLLIPTSLTLLGILIALWKR